jgi:hypothetical protein
MVDRPPWPAVELTGAQPSGRSEPRRRTGGGTLARRGDDVGAVKAKRRSVGGVGVCGGGRVPSMTGVKGASMLPI